MYQNIKLKIIIHDLHSYDSYGYGSSLYAGDL